MRPEPPALAGLAVEWDAPAGVGAFMSTRAGGVSTGPFASLNLGTAVGDEPAAVAANRRRFERAIGARPAWLRQVHGAAVVDAALATEETAADAAFAFAPGLACVVQVADCLPVLYAARNARAVAAAHAGWRGLAAGVLEAALGAVARAAACSAAEVVCWIGPGIGADAFEVGAEVVEALGGGPRFVPSPSADDRPRWRADLAGLARDRLQAAGVRHVAGGRWCTFSESRFFSFRRDRRTGRMAGAVWIER
jgi:hypothetical protein